MREACPRILWSAGRVPPDLRKRIAKVWRRSWSLRSGMPVFMKTSLMAFQRISLPMARSGFGHRLLPLSMVMRR